MNRVHLRLDDSAMTQWLAVVYSMGETKQVRAFRKLVKEKHQTIYSNEKSESSE
jgi:hypothetical protein